ncbi:MAG: hypothetical protein HQM07_08405 [Zetaproteobacteria bacterium]|nr:hypothetical protein [Zetaproteobacteria bacterium]
MLKKRLMGVVTVKGAWAVQSFGYARYLPLGKPEVLIENLDRWGADEILLQVIDRSRQALSPDFSLLERVGKLGLSTPLIYAGGIRSVEDGVRAVALGADRIVVDALFYQDVSIIQSLSERLGAQAIILALPFSIYHDALFLYDYVQKRAIKWTDEMICWFQSRHVSEVMLIDYQHEGSAGMFDMRCLDMFPARSMPLIAFGGVGQDCLPKLLKYQHIVAIAMGNMLNYQEHRIQTLKRELEGEMVRSPYYVADEVDGDVVL